MAVQVGNHFLCLRKLRAAGSDEDQIHALSITRDTPRIAGDAFRMTGDAFWFGPMR